MQAGSSVAVFGCGAVGLAAIMGAKEAGATHIIAVDINPAKWPIGGCVRHGLSLAQTLTGMHQLECTNYNVQPCALTVMH